MTFVARDLGSTSETEGRSTMRVKAMSLWVGFLLLGLPAAAAQQVPAELIRYPQTVFFNGPVLTLDTGEVLFRAADADL